jgi:hypothetical protein
VIRIGRTVTDTSGGPTTCLSSSRSEAIADATAFDPRQVNYNFDYDYEAYEEVKRNLAHLVELGQLRTAMELALVLMKDGSHQVEMSDEGMMTQDIEECLRVVIQAVEACDRPRKDVIAWHAKMRQNDRVGFVAEKDLQALRDQLEASGSPKGAQTPRIRA